MLFCLFVTVLTQENTISLTVMFMQMGTICISKTSRTGLEVSKTSALRGKAEEAAGSPKRTLVLQNDGSPREDSSGLQGKPDAVNIGASASAIVGSRPRAAY